PLIKLLAVPWVVLQICLYIEESGNNRDLDSYNLQLVIV
ncbi:unnamed protein product, partial [marine sediment metagenome]